MPPPRPAMSSDNISTFLRMYHRRLQNQTGSPGTRARWLDIRGPSQGNSNGMLVASGVSVNLRGDGIKYIYLSMGGGKYSEKLPGDAGPVHVMSEAEMEECIAKDLENGAVDYNGHPLSLSEVRSPEFTLMFDLDFKMGVPLPVKFGIHFSREVILPVVNEFYPGFMDTHAANNVLTVCTSASRNADGSGYTTRAKKIEHFHCQRTHPTSGKLCNRVLSRIRTNDGYYECSACKVRWAIDMVNGGPREQPTEQKVGRKWQVYRGRECPPPLKKVQWKTGIHVRFINNKYKTGEDQEPSPLILTKVLSGLPNCAPMVAGRLKPIVPNPPEFIHCLCSVYLKYWAAHI